MSSRYIEIRGGGPRRSHSCQRCGAAIIEWDPKNQTRCRDSHDRVCWSDYADVVVQ